MNFVNKIKKPNLIIYSIKRSFNNDKPYEEVSRKPVENRRFGYKSRYHEFGLQPRLNDQNKPVRKSLLFRPNQYKWAAKNALIGQNDYVDILGNDNLKPHQVLKNIPWYLKGFRGNELQMLTRLQVAKQDWKFTRPQKWKEIQGRMDFLYKFFNFRYKPPYLK